MHFHTHQHIYTGNTRIPEGTEILQYKDKKNMGEPSYENALPRHVLQRKQNRHISKYSDAHNSKQTCFHYD